MVVLGMTGNEWQLNIARTHRLLDLVKNHIFIMQCCGSRSIPLNTVVLECTTSVVGRSHRYVISSPYLGVHTIGDHPRVATGQLVSPLLTQSDSKAPAKREMFVCVHRDY